MRGSAGVESDPQARRLRWRCRRGMKELDVLLERYLRVHLAAAGADERRLFTRLLDLPDPLLVDYIFGHANPPEPELAQLLAHLRSAG